MYSSSGDLLGSFKTTIRKYNHNPQFNEISVFQVHPHDLESVFFRVTIYQVLGEGEQEKELEIGRCLIGHNKENSENSHWTQMIRLVRRQVMLWHSIV